MPLHSKPQATVWHLWVCSYWGVLELIFKRDGERGAGMRAYNETDLLIWVWGRRLRSEDPGSWFDKQLNVSAFLLDFPSHLL